MLSRAYRISSRSCYFYHLVMILTSVSLCNMHPALNDTCERGTKQRTRKTQRLRERKRKEETETKMNKKKKEKKKGRKHDTESRFHKLLRSL